MEVRALELKELIKKGENALKDANIVDYKIDAWLIAEFILKISKVDYYLNPNKIIENEHIEMYLNAIEKRAANIPLQHITMTQEFMGFEFEVNENVLIPRQDTETLVEEVREYIGNKSMRVLDMCTGSGCIAIAVDKICENAEVFAADISEKALEISNKNNKKLGSNVTFIKSDMFKNIKDCYDVIISNPPYIRTSDIENLMDEVKLHDPVLALDGDEDGLKFYEIIGENVGSHLKRNGMLFLEIGYDQGKDVVDILEKNNMKDIKVIKDLSGNDRVVTGRK